MSVMSSMIDRQILSTDPSTVEHQTGATAGQTLRAVREAAGLHIATLAVALKVPVKKLEALEADRHDQLPDTVFSRALASSVCRHLKIDPVPILALLPQTARQQLSDDDTHLNARFPSAPGSMAAGSFGVSQVTLGAVAAFLLLAAVILYWPQIRAYVSMFIPATESRPSAMADSAGVSGTSGTIVESASSRPSVHGAPRPADAGAGEVPRGELVTPVRSDAALSSASAAGARTAAAAAAGAPALPAPAASAAMAPSVGQALLALTARGASWVDITDARGASVFRRTLQAGESADVAGTPPLSAVIGRADITEVRVRGRSLDLTPFVRDNVARFEVK